MFCSNSLDLILSNICSINNSTEKCRKTVIKHVFGVAKTRTWTCFFGKPYSWFIYTPTLKIYLLLIIKNPIKIRQICHSDKIYPLSYPISSKPTKIKHFSHFTTKKSNFHFTINPPTNLKFSLFISTFTDKHFPSKNYKLYYQY